MKKSNLFLLFIFIPFIANGQISERIDSLALVHEYEGFNGNILYSRNDSIIFTGNYGSTITGVGLVGNPWSCIFRKAMNIW